MEASWDINQFKPVVYLTGLVAQVRLSPYHGWVSRKVKIETGDQFEIALGDLMGGTPKPDLLEYSQFIAES